MFSALWGNRNSGDGGNGSGDGGTGQGQGQRQLIFNISAAMQNQTQGQGLGRGLGLGSINPFEIRNVPVPTTAEQFNSTEGGLPLSAIPHHGRNLVQNEDTPEVDIVSGTGYVTRFEPIMPKGIIDGLYFFDKTIVGPEIVLGTKVDFTAERKRGIPFWEARKVVLSKKDINVPKEIPLFKPNKGSKEMVYPNDSFDYTKFQPMVVPEEEAAGLPMEYSTNLSILREDKQGIKIMPEKHINFQCVYIHSSIARNVAITNYSDDIVILRDIEVANRQSICQFKVAIGERESKDILTIIEPNRSKQFTVHCTPIMSGSTKDYLFFKFNGFEIVRTMSAVCKSNDHELVKEITSTGMLVSKNWVDIRTPDNIEEVRRRRLKPEGKVFRGPNPMRPAFFAFPKDKDFSKLSRIPEKLWTLVKQEDEQEFLQELPVVAQQLCMENYKERFQIALWLEEIENDILRSQFDCLAPHFEELEEPGTYLAHVPYLKSIYPAVIVGDKVTVHDNVDKSSTFESYIYAVNEDTIALKFVNEFKEWLSQATFLKMEFGLRRAVYERCHFAIHLAIEHLGENWLFPKACQLKPPRITFTEMRMARDPRLNPSRLGTVFRQSGVSYPRQQFPDMEGKTFGLFAGRLVSRTKTFESDTKGPIPQIQSNVLTFVNKDLNEEQKNAVRGILRGRGRPLPYIIFGPPGTGKTVTAVEAIHQIYKLDAHSRILVVAPSNSAADNVVEHIVRYSVIQKQEFARLIGFTRQEYQIPTEIREYCHDGEDIDILAKLRLVITTCGTAGQFYNLGIRAGHFTHVVVDEAGYCTEPETLIASCLVALEEKEGQVVLCGDHQQLGPVLMSTAAQACGLGLSFLERLTKRELYSRNPESAEKYNPDFCTKLIKNYRAHPILLKLPSLMFYDDELMACADPVMTSLTDSLTFIKPNGKPLIFHGIRGKSQREPASPSWYNIAEVNQVIQYVENLSKDGVSFKDIGIITPYKKQVEKIRIALKAKQLGRDEIKVGSVEEFQGQERKVIIVSLVRSQPERHKGDLKDRLAFTMGFIYSPKRFNVALTRAKALMVVLGDPFIMSIDSNWYAFITYCMEMGSYTGCHLPNTLEDLILKIKPTPSTNAPNSCNAEENMETDSSDLHQRGPEVPDREW